MLVITATQWIIIKMHYQNEDQVKLHSIRRPKIRQIKLKSEYPKLKQVLKFSSRFLQRDCCLFSILAMIFWKLHSIGDFQIQRWRCTEINESIGCWLFILSMPRGHPQQLSSIHKMKRFVLERVHVLTNFLKREFLFTGLFRLNNYW